MDKEKISEARYVIVTFDDTSKKKYYSYKTFFADLSSDDTLLVTTKNGIKSVTFVGYVDDNSLSIIFSQEVLDDYRQKASKWIIGKLDEDEIQKNINISNMKDKIKKCVKVIEGLKDKTSTLAVIKRQICKEQLDKLLEEYSKLI